MPAAPDGRSHTDELLATSAKIEAELTKELYREYSQLRRDLYAQLRRAHPNLPALDVIGHAQTILDRVLFIAFAEDRGLLPSGTIAEACRPRNEPEPTPLWRNFVTIFRWISEGNPERQLPAYGGGLFRRAPDIEALDVSDAMCEGLKELTRFDLRDEISVNALGHVFERSISDLEEMRAEASQAAPARAAKESKRRKEGVFYTPAYVTRYIVDQTLGRALRERFEAIYDAHKPDDKKREEDKEQAWITVWEAYREAMKSVRVLDPACGSGAFLVAAYEALAREYDRVNAALAALRQAQVELFDLNKTVLNNNLFGVDLSPESVEITKLSLWLKTAERGRQLTYLDSNIKWGNSIVSDPGLCVQAFDWRTGQHAKPFLDPEAAPEAAAIDVRWREGFDVVIGNPPYVRQELLTAIKPHLEARYTTYHGMADLYVYFFERGLHELKPGGRLGFIVANKWLRSSYAEGLRELLASQTRIESLIDFGHAPVFPDADAFPCIVTVYKRAEDKPRSAEETLDVTTFPRELLHEISIPEYVAGNRYKIPQGRLRSEGWNLEPPAADALLAKIRAAGPALSSYAGKKIYYGLKTGLNEAFLVDAATRDRLVHEAPSSIGLFHKYLRGQDIARWTPEWAGLWLILLKSSGDSSWPWSGLNGALAEEAFRSTFPSVHRHMKPMEEKLRKRSDKGQHWWELRSCAYYDAFLTPKIVYQVIQFHSAFALDDAGFFLNDKGFFLPTADAWLLAVLNSPLMWWHNWRYLTHLKDEALTPLAVKMEALAIAEAAEETRGAVEVAVAKLRAITQSNISASFAVIDSLRMQFDVETPGQKLEDFASLNPDAFVKEVLARRPKSAGKLKASTLKDLRQVYLDEAPGVQERRREAATLERRLSDLVNEAYGLTPEEVELMWSTAPPRIPAGR